MTSPKELGLMMRMRLNPQSAIRNPQFLIVASCPESGANAAWPAPPLSTA
jgi:hypothetical protein